ACAVRGWPWMRVISTKQASNGSSCTACGAGIPCGANDGPCGRPRTPPPASSGAADTGFAAAEPTFSSTKVDISNQLFIIIDQAVRVTQPLACRLAPLQLLQGLRGEIGQSQYSPVQQGIY